ncbi:MULTISPECIES: translesion DNA synthesis-associated protein ImuA [unclassified Arsukibacterium]|uniref:translesion DNA synthesis-associated protein ImuA n=1 Tax=unclassified Arsukibacterium TaxID=2635278 RepID=UPI000C931C5B|nr:MULTISPECIES: translesion DNA synthesis-associated protein ImuA [unclassified Arsukibacterium]MAA95479.1 recombinase RecA [Rheinheimera sp.]HAW94379.1 translesion DNA synthesis-associated protein ImuA [Candidatus Azambacteria bacterium]|tara:strand:+ start:335 stop:1090 length:756 start_codon:yes stop_codon:yes gene_type:complete
MSALLDQLSRRQLVWHGDSQQLAYQPVSSGYQELDQQLGGGLPATGLIDIQTEAGIGELRLLLPYLQQQQQHSQRLLVFIGPPAELCADMLAGCDLELSQLLIITPGEQPGAGQGSDKLTKLTTAAENPKSVKKFSPQQQALWAAEQCLQSGCCASVLLWPAAISLAQARRLQLAAEQGAASMIVFRHSSQTLSLPVNLSISLQPDPFGLQLTVLKRKGSWPAAPFRVSMQQQWPALCLADKTAEPLRQAG